MFKITIYLGSKCNMNCPYCHRESDNKDPLLSKKLLHLLSEKYNQYNHNIIIKFMGGEPLLYFDIIEKIVNKFPLAKFHISTNGKLLDEYKEFLIKNNFFVILSFENTNLRGYDPLNKELDYPNLGISSVLYHNNCDLYKIIKSFTDKEQIIKRGISFYPHLIHFTNSDNEKYNLTFKDIDFIVNQIQEIIDSFIISLKSGFPNRKYEGVLFTILRRFYNNFDMGETSCFNRNLIKVDLNGDMYPCHYIRENLVNQINYKEIVSNLVLNLPSKCNKCRFYKYCGAACIKSKSHNIECYYYTKLFTYFEKVYNENKEIIDSYAKEKLTNA